MTSPADSRGAGDPQGVSFGAATAPVHGDSVELWDDAPLAGVRKAIMAP